MQRSSHYTLWPPHSHCSLLNEPHITEFSRLKASAQNVLLFLPVRIKHNIRTKSHFVAHVSIVTTWAPRLCAPSTASLTQPRAWVAQHRLNGCATSNGAMCSIYRAEKFESIGTLWQLIAPWWVCGAPARPGEAPLPSEGVEEVRGFAAPPQTRHWVDGALRFFGAHADLPTVSRRSGTRGICRGAPRCAGEHGCAAWMTD